MSKRAPHEMHRPAFIKSSWGRATALRILMQASEYLETAMFLTLDSVAFELRTTVKIQKGTSECLV